MKSTKTEKNKDYSMILIIGFLIFSLSLLFSYSSIRTVYTVNLPIDEVGGAVTIINYEHHEIHEGDHYFLKTYIENTGGTGTSDYFAFTTPSNTKLIHARTLLSPDGDVLITIYEDCNITGGINITGLNNFRNSNNTALLQPVAAPTVVNCYLPIWQSRNGGGRNPVGVSPGFNYEIIAKSNVTYVFEITKQTTADTIVDIDFWWYEEG